MRLPPLPVLVRMPLSPRCRKKILFSHRYRKQLPSTLCDAHNLPQIPPVVETERLSQPPPEQTVALRPETGLSDITPVDDEGTWVFYVGNVSTDSFPHGHRILIRGKSSIRAQLRPSCMTSSKAKAVTPSGTSSSVALVVAV